MPNRTERRSMVAKLRLGELKTDFRVKDYLDRPSPWQSQIKGAVPGMILTNRQVMALLIAKNGFTPKVTRWGQFSGPFGLTQPEAFLLMEMTPYLQGLIDGGGLDSVKVLAEHLEPALNELVVQFEAISKAMPVEEPEEGAPAALEEGGNNGADSVEKVAEAAS